MKFEKTLPAKLAGRNATYQVEVTGNSVEINVWNKHGSDTTRQKMIGEFMTFLKGKKFTRSFCRSMTAVGHGARKVLRIEPLSPFGTQLGWRVVFRE